MPKSNTSSIILKGRLLNLWILVFSMLMLFSVGILGSNLFESTWPLIVAPEMADLFSPEEICANETFASLIESYTQVSCNEILLSNYTFDDLPQYAFLFKYYPEDVHLLHVVLGYSMIKNNTLVFVVWFLFMWVGLRIFKTYMQVSNNQIQSHPKDAGNLTSTLAAIANLADTKVKYLLGHKTLSKLTLKGWRHYLSLGHLKLFLKGRELPLRFILQHELYHFKTQDALFRLLTKPALKILTDCTMLIMLLHMVTVLVLTSRHLGWFPWVVIVILGEFVIGLIFVRALYRFRNAFDHLNEHLADKMGLETTELKTAHFLFHSRHNNATSHPANEDRLIFLRKGHTLALSHALLGVHLIYTFCYFLPQALLGHTDPAFFRRSYWLPLLLFVIFGDIFSLSPKNTILLSLKTLMIYLIPLGFLKARFLLFPGFVFGNHAETIKIAWANCLAMALLTFLFIKMEVRDD